MFCFYDVMHPPNLLKYFLYHDYKSLVRAAPNNALGALVRNVSSEPAMHCMIIPKWSAPQHPFGDRCILLADIFQTWSVYNDRSPWRRPPVLTWYLCLTRVGWKDVHWIVNLIWNVSIDRSIHQAAIKMTWHWYMCPVYLKLKDDHVYHLLWSGNGISIQ